MLTGLPRRIVLPAALITVVVLAAPEACFFPSYTFDLKSTGGGGTGGATSSTSSSSSTTTTSSTSGGGKGGAPGCTDADCSDPACASEYECVEAIPAGWTAAGYVALYEGPTGQSVPDCPADPPTKVYTGSLGITSAPPICTPCGCGGATGQGCELANLSNDMPGPDVMEVRNTPCSDPDSSAVQSLTVPVPWGGGCYFAEELPGGMTCGTTSPGPCNSSVETVAPVPSGGMCAATGGTVSSSTAPPTWSSTAKACGGTKLGKGCPTGQACVPKPPSPFNPHVCIEQTGQVACPTGSSFSTQYVYYGGYDDQRGCTSCTCGAPSGGTCGITISLYSDTTVGTCATQVAQFVAGANGGCADLTGNPAIYGRTAQVTTPPSGSTCSPTSSSMPTSGTAVETMPTTFCCP